MEKKMSKKLGLMLTGSLILFNTCLLAENKVKLSKKKKQVITVKTHGYNEAVSLKGDKKGNKQVISGAQPFENVDAILAELTK